VASMNRIRDSFTALANLMNPVPPVVVDQAYVEKWMKDQLEAVVKRQEHAENIEQLPPPAPIT
jgi:hypothetical protein